MLRILEGHFKGVRPHSARRAITPPPKYLASQDHSMEGPPLAGQAFFQATPQTSPLNGPTRDTFFKVGIASRCPFEGENCYSPVLSS